MIPPAHIEHNITNLVVDEAEGKASTEQSCPHVKTGGELDHVITCNFFSFDEAGKFMDDEVESIDGDLLDDESEVLAAIRILIP